MGLLADPAGLDRTSKRLERCVWRQVGEIVFTLAARTALSDKPDFFARHVLSAHVTDALWWSVGDPHSDSGEAGGKAPSGAAALAERPPGCLGEHGHARTWFPSGMRGSGRGDERPEATCRTV